MIKIYGGDLSSPANKVRFTANAIGIDYEYIQVKIREGEHRTPEFLAMNPVGKIPVLDDNGFIVFESGAICKYLVIKHESSLYPQDLKQRTRVEQWTDFSTLHINTAMSKVIFNRVFYQFAKVEKDERSLQDGINFLKRFLPVVEGQLEENTYLVNDQLSLADLTLLSALDPAEIAEVDLSQYQNLTRWRAGLKQESFYTKCYASYGEPLKRILGKK
ncbi:MAG: glutathione S-transferase family protein [Candidatus Omnitrophica bacterium]|nr:glutathione S-transferase family protein [Candidatus Omnitrophota bacterium]